jgi:cell division protein FtsW (lipid II flippase)
MQNTSQSRLLKWAGIYLALYCLILSLSAAVRERSWNVDYRLSHWIGFLVWALLVYQANRVMARRLQDCDPFLFPVACLLSGWGILTIWRLDPAFGIRQTLWFALSIGVIILGVRLSHNLLFLRRYKYILLGLGLLLTALTLILGTNPLGAGPRLWLGCCGVYFQPSEPLKLLLVIYLAAYFADRLPVRIRLVPLLLPTLAVMGVALLLLLVQRDLGTASLFILLYTIMVFLVTGRRRVLLGAFAALALALLIGYLSVEIIRIRVDAWINPWIDPSDRSYQIIQSLLAIANGGTIGRGPGIGNPSLVPVAISDFVFAAIAEESGLLGTLALLIMIWIILARGMLAALLAPDRFRRYLAGGLTAYLGIQSILIIGGNLRLLPLTGVTLPFVSYGGSSLLTSFIALLLLVHIGTSDESEPAILINPHPYTILTGLFMLALAAIGLTNAWWSIYRGPDLLSRTDNPRRAIADRYVPRGDLVDRNNRPIDAITGASGAYIRVYEYPELGPVTGYTHPVFGQAGLEASLDPYLRGLQGNPTSLVWWDHLLYGTPPPGLDVRLSVDLSLQTLADQLLGGHPGAVVLLNAESGEILAMASHPTFDPNKLDEEGVTLRQDPAAPLVNRATQGLYPIGTLLLPLVQARFGEAKPGESDLYSFYESLGFFRAPELHLPAAEGQIYKDLDKLYISPLQAGLAASSLSSHGLLPNPRIAMAVNTPKQGWVVLPASSEATEVLQPRAADETAAAYATGNGPFWQHVGQASREDELVTWLLAGTLPEWGGPPLSMVVILEENNIFLAQHIGTEILRASINQ